MKHNVRTINGKRIVGGDPNLATKNEIHVSKIPEELGISVENANTKMLYFRWTEEQLAKDEDLQVLIQLFKSGKLPVFMCSEVLISGDVIGGSFIVNVPGAALMSMSTYSGASFEDMTVFGFRFSDLGTPNPETGTVMYFKDMLEIFNSNIGVMSGVPENFVDTLYKYKVTEQQYTDGVIALTGW